MFRKVIEVEWNSIWLINPKISENGNGGKLRRMMNW
jgi:hypothetical protein